MIYFQLLCSGQRPLMLDPVAESSIQLDLHTSRDEAFTTFPQSHQFSRNDDVRGGMSEVSQRSRLMLSVPLPLPINEVTMKLLHHQKTLLVRHNLPFVEPYCLFLIPFLSWISSNIPYRRISSMKVSKFNIINLILTYFF